MPFTIIDTEQPDAATVQINVFGPKSRFWISVTFALGVTISPPPVVVQTPAKGGGKSSYIANITRDGIDRYGTTLRERILKRENKRNKKNEQ